MVVVVVVFVGETERFPSVSFFALSLSGDACVPLVSPFVVGCCLLSLLSLLSLPFISTDERLFSLLLSLSLSLCNCASVSSCSVSVSMSVSPSISVSVSVSLCSPSVKPGPLSKRAALKRDVCAGLSLCVCACLRFIFVFIRCVGFALGD